MTRVKRGIVTKKQHKKLLKQTKGFGDNARMSLSEQKKHCSEL